MTEILANPQFASLTTAFTKAASDTGVSFDFLVKTAARESGLQSSAKAKTSSAAGLFQFVEQTWLGMISRYGAEQGLAKEAAAIQKSENGRYSVQSSAIRNQILKLRHDPQISTQMAAKLTVENGEILQRKLGRVPTDAELYVAHFMGAGKAGELLQAAMKTPDQAAKQMFPKEAAANPSIFVSAKGVARSVADVVKNLKQAHSADPVSASTIVDRAVTTATRHIGTSLFSPIAGGVVRSPLLQLSPTIIRLLSELSAPGASEKSIKNS